MFLIHNLTFKNKPTSYEVATIQKTWNNATLTNDINTLIKALNQGQTIKFNTTALNTIIIDADNPNYQLEHYLNTLKEHNLLPTLAYKSFSANDINKHNFRLIYFTNNLTKDSYFNFTNKLENLLDIKLDYAFVLNHKQICYGTNKQIYHFNQPELSLDNTPLKEQINTLKQEFIADKANDIIYLNSLPYKQFINELKSILKLKKHISYDLTLRWVFANYNNPNLINEILQLSSNDTQQKIINLLNQKPDNYLLQLTNKNSNFYKIYLSNKKKYKVLK